MSVLTKSAHTQRALFSADVHTAKYIFVLIFMHNIIIIIILALRDSNCLKSLVTRKKNLKFKK